MSPADALYRAVCAAPHDDLPRLVYADWLEENGRGERAEFIRVQCRLANASPADADYVDLLEREAELKAILWRELDADRPTLPHGIGWEPEHRGFAERLRFGNTHSLTGTAELVEQVSAGVPISGLKFEQITPERFRQFASGEFHTTVTSVEISDAPQTRLPLTTPLREGRFPHLRRLVITEGGGTDLLTALAATPHVLHELNLGALFLDRPTLGFPSAGSLRSLVLGGGLGQIESPLPELHTLSVGRFDGSDAEVFTALPKLASVTAATTQGDWVSLLSKRNRPLAELRATFGTARTPLVALFRKEWMTGLRVFAPAGISDSVRAVLESPRLIGLRQLWLKGVNPDTFRPTDLVNGRWWESLTTFDAPPRFPKPRDGTSLVRQMLAPRLKHLNLMGIPLGDAGAVALAANASLANLTRLNLSACRIGPRGVEALLNSPHLQRLIELNLYANQGGEALSLLADPGVLPHLGLADVAANGVSDELRRRLEHRPAIRAR